MHGCRQEPIQLRTPTGLLPGARATMERHGCVVEDGCVTLPVGSKRTRCLQVLTLTHWYEIRLPDQYQMLEAYDRHRELSILYLPSQEQKEKRNE